MSSREISNSKMGKDFQLETVQLMALYTVLVDMIDKKRIGIMEARSILEKAGLVSNDKDQWFDENGREVCFTIPFPAFELDTQWSRNNPDSFTVSNGVDPYVGC